MDWSNYSPDLPDDQQEVLRERKENEELEAEAENTTQDEGYDY